MFLHIRRITCCIFTLIASVRILACVFHNMALESISPSCFIIALVTLMRLFLHMFSYNVAFQLLFGCGRKLAGRASVRLFPGVNLFVVLQMRKINCCIFTLIASIRLLTSVLYYMELEMTSQSGFIIALVAFE